MQQKEILLVVAVFAVVLLFNNYRYTGMTHQVDWYAKRNPAYAHLFGRSPVRQTADLPPFSARSIGHITPAYTESLPSARASLLGGPCTMPDGVKGTFTLNEGNKILCT